MYSNNAFNEGGAITFNLIENITLTNLTISENKSNKNAGIYL